MNTVDLSLVVGHEFKGVAPEALWGVDSELNFAVLESELEGHDGIVSEVHELLARHLQPDPLAGMDDH